MANYQITGRNGDGAPLVSVSIGSIDQEEHVVEEIDVVNAVRAFLASVDGVAAVVAQISASLSVIAGS